MKNLLRRISMILLGLAGMVIVVVFGLYILRPKAPMPAENLNHIGEMEAYFDQVVAAEHPPGLSVAVVKNGEIVYANGFGTVDESRNRVASQDTVYHWWSITKIVTAVAVMQLDEQGLLNIDDPVHDYLPYFNVTYKGEQQMGVSIRQLLNHTAGLSNATPEIFTWVHLEGGSPVNQSELVVEKFADYDELHFLPGEKTQYSNWGYVVLGALIEAVSGQTYEKYIVENILRPLNMQNTNFVYTESMALNEATGSQHVIDQYTIFFPLLKLNYLIKERAGARYWFHRVYNDQTPPSGLIGSVMDMALFMNAYLDGGGGILQPETIALMNSATESLPQPGDSVQGLGWRAHLTAAGRRYLTHSGGGPGFATILRVYPEENMGVAVMGNDSTIDRETLADVLANMEWMLGDDDTNTTLKRPLSIPPQTHAEVKDEGQDR